MSLSRTMHNNLLGIHKYEAEDEDLMAEVLEGLNQFQKKLPSKLFYDQKGSELFDQICDLKEYYLTQTEMWIMNRYIDEISSMLGEKCLLIELGSGSSTKVRMLLDHLDDPVGYVPVDISLEHLLSSANSIARDYPNIKVLPVYADYTQPFVLPDISIHFSKKVIYYPGSTIGNFTPTNASRFINRIAENSGNGSGFLIGVDLKKDTKTLEAAYNDKEGVTAAFNLNMLERLNGELKTDFDLSQWRHHAFYNMGEGRIEMHLVSLMEQQVSLNGTGIEFKKDETILTEYSYKYSANEFEELLEDGFKVEKVWTDEENKFSVQYMTAR